MKEAALYVHGKDGSAAESEHYKAQFPECEVVGLDYQTFTPWETGAEIRAAVETLKAEDKRVILIANSIGAYFSMNAGIDALIEKAWFISPIVDMEKLITDMMRWANVTEAELEAREPSALRSVRICPGTTSAMCETIPPAGQRRRGSSMEAWTT